MILNCINDFTTELIKFNYGSIKKHIILHWRYGSVNNIE